ncbi:MAG: hypothetical protein SVR08_16045 [Spirochaetota bacterium]|nr:hypothetical protein [Spirochaetota bacterium]
MKCIGYGNKENKCKNKVGKKSPYWCDSCESDRRITIRAQLEDILKSFEEEEKKE